MQDLKCADQGGINFVGYRINSLELRQIAGREPVHRREHVGATAVVHCREIAQTIAEHETIRPPVFIGPLAVNSIANMVQGEGACQSELRAHRVAVTAPRDGGHEPALAPYRAGIGVCLLQGI